MKLALIKSLIWVGLKLFDWGMSLADKWNLEDSIWIEVNDLR
jgi:hypothetical protein